MKFSILMSLYNNETASNLEECFCSLYNQSLKAEEVVLVIDGPIGSDLLAVVEKWACFLNIIKVKIDENVGLGKALNHGLKFCKNNYIARMDTDDICFPERFESQMSYLIKNPELAILGSNIIEFNRSKELSTGVRKVPFAYEDILKYCKFRNPFNHMSIIFNKKIIQEVGGYHHHYFMEDYNLWLRVISSGYKVENINKNLVYARSDSASIARRRGLKYIASEYKLALLKAELGIQKKHTALTYFMLRATSRVMPSKLLKLVYNQDRK
ncbi:glycosyltransferase [Buttiauxella selenatireducens]|uniref:Glycosyltransferase n=1 Tax=Buttiauxella selenatireducens TaxID=3073902 RepID=A0ABY9SCH0_9ENTR|nr:glycosyltransferase [Buttiauxella sp. R73]WMY74580.1 glycosyltransferase [Buttiauxella sp. R73]